MFKKTRARLTILNSLMFILFIGILGTVIYSYSHTRLYAGIDNMLLKVSKEISNGEMDEMPNRLSRDPRMNVYVWDENHKLIQSRASAPGNHDQDIRNVYPKKLNELVDVVDGPFYYRSIAVELRTPTGKVTVQFLRSTTSEKEMLNMLLLILLVGCGIGSVCAIGIGYFLAGKALVPIEKAWIKQQEFVSDASHELRTPLAVIQSKTDVLFQHPDATVEERVVDISIISKECRRLSKLVGNLLVLARSDSNQMEMEKNTFSLDGLLTEVTEHYSELASFEEKNITLHTTEGIMLDGDKGKIHQLVVILLDNAIKYTKIAGEISVSCSENQSSIILTVKDTGLGMSEEQIPKIFDRFYRGDTARTDVEGAGLGLSIAKWIIDQHYGKIKVDSQLGLGTTFEIIFPKNQNIR